MFETIVNKDSGITTLRCAITSREHIFKTADAGGKKRVMEAAEGFQRDTLHKLGFDVAKQQPLEVYRAAWVKYQQGLGR